jgi:nucleoid DNA-binding protein
MTKNQLALFVSEKHAVSQKAAADMINTVLEGISSGLEKGEPTSLPGFGGFKVVERSAREGRNPQTGEKLHIPASKVVKFTPGKALKQRIQ